MSEEHILLAILGGFALWRCFILLARSLAYAIGEGWHAARVDQLIRLERLTSGEDDGR